MKNCLLILLLFICKSAFSQFNDNFNDGNFTNDPVWRGDTSSFLINNTGQLQTKVSGVSESVSLSTENFLAKSVRWEFYIRLDFDPSTTNRLRIYLTSDNENLKEPLQGYFIQIGETGNSDSYDLYRQSGNQTVKIIDGPEEVRTTIDQLICRIRVTRDKDGLWNLSTDSTGGYNFKTQGTVADDTYIQSARFGIVCQYTSTRSDKFHLDDFKIDDWESNTPTGYEATTNDIVINEIFLDPAPSVDLPDAEFIELWNRTSHNISLRNWTYADANRSFRFSKDSLSAGEYVIICANADTAQLKKFGRVIGIASWPALNNNSDHLALKDNNGRLINEVSYSDTWYQNDQKKMGGWTLEQIDPDAVCKGIRNWQASTDLTGGTPGRRNSVYKLADLAGPLKIAKVAMIDSVSLSLNFNQYTDSLTAIDTKNYTVNNGAGNPQSVYYSDMLTVILKFSEPLTRGNTYQITVSNLRNCSGSIISSALNPVTFSIPKKIVKGDILISEILFNPRAEGVDFVEIYNNSNQELDIHELYIGNVPLPDSLSKAKRLSTDQRLIKAGGFLVLTSDPEKVKKEYHTENPNDFLKVASLPSFNNDKGIVTILRNNEMVDQFAYTEKMHMPLIRDADGISLERSNYQIAANEPGNFRSATASAGFATPGYKNSQYLEEPGIKDDFSLVSSTFSPDDDGFEDLMQINYLLDKPGFVANITIYNDRGNIVRKLYQNYSLGTSGILHWDGRDELSELKTAGIYLVYAELFNTEGHVKKFRNTVVLARKFN